MEILGVDYSGARTDDRTWMTRGFMDRGNLVLQDCRMVRRAELADMLVSLDQGSVAAMDFPSRCPRNSLSFGNPTQPACRTCGLRPRRWTWPSHGLP